MSTALRGPVSRRAVLAGLGAAACGPSGAGEPGPSSSAFPLGVASGGVRPDGALLWTRLALAGPLSVRLWKAGDDEATTARSVRVAVDEAGFAHQDVGGLEARTWYRYRFVAGDAAAPSAESEAGRFRTAPDLDALVPITFGACSCMSQSFPLEPLRVAGERDDLDAFLLLGDTVYADGGRDLPSYRQRWASGIGRYPQRVLRASTSLVATWDDHEVQNNYGGDVVPPAMLEAARTSFFDFMPVPRLDGSYDRIWRSVRFGRTAEVFVLDCRSERDHAQKRYLSQAQLDWLVEGLAASPATFKVVLNSVPIARYENALFEAFADDRWEGYPAQRLELLSALDARGVTGLLWLAGDFHLGCVGRVALEGPGKDWLEALVGPGGMISNPSPTYPGPPQFDFATGLSTFSVVKLDPATREATLSYVDGRGRTLFERAYVL